MARALEDGGAPAESPAGGGEGGGLLDLLRLVQGRDRVRLLLVKLGMRVPILRDRLADRPIALRLRPLAGARFYMRPGRQDLATVLHAFVQGQHIPPAQVEREGLRVICELGANVGASALALAVSHPEAFVLAAEPDPANANLARLNAAAFGDRCKVVEVALWDEACRLTLDGPATDALVARPATEEPRSDAWEVDAVTIDQLLDEHLPDQVVDYMHVCIEGSEPRVLAAGGEWPKRVRSLRVELYEELGFDGPACVAALERLGYSAWFEPEPNSCGYGFGVHPELRSGG